jgi:hypothetical protein
MASATSGLSSACASWAGTSYRTRLAIRWLSANATVSARELRHDA